MVKLNEASVAGRRPKPSKGLSSPIGNVRKALASDIKMSDIFSSIENIQSRFGCKNAQIVVCVILPVVIC